jgi:hypothetical protein
VLGADAFSASALLCFPSPAMFGSQAPDDKKEHSVQVKTRPTLNQVSEMLSFVF